VCVRVCVCVSFYWHPLLFQIVTRLPQIMDAFGLPAARDESYVLMRGAPYIPSENDHDSFGDLIPAPSTKDNYLEETFENLEQFERNCLQNGPDRVLQRVFLGDKGDGQAEWQIQKLGITHVLNVHNSCRFPSDDCGYEYLHQPMSDGGQDDLIQFLPKVLPFLCQGAAAGGVLVHCQMGVNRSATVVMCYLMLHQQFSLRRAFLHTQAIRPQVNPHELYFEQMQRLEQQSFGNVTLTREDIGPSLQQMMRNIRAEAEKERDAAGVSLLNEMEEEIELVD